MVDTLTPVGEFDHAAGSDCVALELGAAPAAEPPARPARAPRPPNVKRDAKHHGRLIRRAAGISAYVGPNGSGKSLAMIFDTLPTLDGMPWACTEPTHRHMSSDYVDPLTGVIGATTGGIRRVLSTVELLDSETGLPHRLYDRLSPETGGWAPVLYAEHTDILFDEVTGIAGSRESAGMPVAVQNILQQLRRRDVLLRWTAPRWERADSLIRGTTQFVTVCKGSQPNKKLMRSLAEPPAWVPNQLFKWRTFDARDMDDFTLAKASGDKKNQPKMSALKARPVAWLWGPGSRAFASYDTYGQVTRVADYLDGGRCAHCGGKRAIPSCVC